jgi:hypothetical protein
VKSVFVYAHPGFRDDTLLNTKLTDLSKKAKKAGVRMWAMGGDPSWVTNHKVAIDWINEVVASRLFSGVHFEIEPHSQAGYWDNQTERNQQFVSLLNKANTAAGPLPLELSLPWWFHTIAYGDTTLDEAAISEVDQITIVTFNDVSAGIEMNAENAQVISREQNKPYRLASETNANDTAWVTFAGETNAHMLTTQNEVSTARANDPLYLGFAVHDYSGWKQLA